MCHALVMLLEEGDRGNIVPCHEVPQVHIGSIIFREGKRLLPMYGLRRGMAMIAHLKPVLVCKLTDSFEIRVLVRDLGGNGSSTQRFGQRERVLQLVVRHLE